MEPAWETKVRELLADAGPRGVFGSRLGSDVAKSRVAMPAHFETAVRGMVGVVSSYNSKHQQTVYSLEAPASAGVPPVASLGAALAGRTVPAIPPRLPSAPTATAAPEPSPRLVDAVLKLLVTQFRGGWAELASINDALMQLNLLGELRGARLRDVLARLPALESTGKLYRLRQQPSQLPAATISARDIEAAQMGTVSVPRAAVIVTAGVPFATAPRAFPPRPVDVRPATAPAAIPPSGLTGNSSTLANAVHAALADLSDSSAQDGWVSAKSLADAVRPTPAGAMIPAEKGGFQRAVKELPGVETTYFKLGRTDQPHCHFRLARGAAAAPAPVARPPALGAARPVSAGGRTAAAGGGVGGRKLTQEAIVDACIAVLVEEGRGEWMDGTHLGTAVRGTLRRGGYDLPKFLSLGFAKVLPSVEGVKVERDASQSKVRARILMDSVTAKAHRAGGWKLEPVPTAASFARLPPRREATPELLRSLIPVMCEALHRVARAGGWGGMVPIVRAARVGHAGVSLTAAVLRRTLETSGRKLAVLRMPKGVKLYRLLEDVQLPDKFGLSPARRVGVLDGRSGAASLSGNGAGSAAGGGGGGALDDDGHLIEFCQEVPPDYEPDEDEEDEYEEEEGEGGPHPLLGHRANGGSSGALSPHARDQDHRAYGDWEVDDLAVSGDADYAPTY